MSHIVACTIVFPLFYEWGWQGGVFKVKKNDHFLVFLTVWVVFPSFWVGKGMTYIKIAWNDKSATYNCVANCFYFILGSKFAGRSAPTYEKLSFFNIFNRLDLFPLVSGQVKESLMSELHKRIRMSHVIVYSIVFFLLFYERVWQGGVFKVMKNDHLLLFLAVWGLFPTFLGRWKSGLY